MGSKLVVGKNDLASQFPDTAALFDIELNGCPPSAVFAKTNKTFWWHCDNGLPHKYLMRPNNKTTKGYSCPICSGQLLLSGFNDLETRYPNIAMEWDYDRNVGKPSDYRYGSGYAAWWKCRKCGLSYQSPINVHIRGHGCPYCSGLKIMPGMNDLQTLFPDIASEYLNNNVIPVTEISPGTHKKVRWKCPDCGSIYEASPHHRTSGNRTGCPNCRKQSKGERKVKQVLDHYGISYKQQEGFENLVGNRKSGKMLTYDFTVYDAGVWKGAIEFNGVQHYRPVEIFGGKTAFDMQFQHDLLKTKYCLEHGIPILHIQYKQSGKTTEEMVTDFLIHLGLIERSSDYGN